MGTTVPFEGMNVVYNPPEGVPEDICGKAYVFRNGRDIVTCWQLTPEELADVIRTGGKVWFTMQSGKTLYPHFIGSERTVHKLCADDGPVWKLSDDATPPQSVEDTIHRVMKASFECWNKSNGTLFTIDDMSDEEKEFARQHAIVVINAMTNPNPPTNPPPT